MCSYLRTSAAWLILPQAPQILPARSHSQERSVRRVMRFCVWVLLARAGRMAHRFKLTTHVSGQSISELIGRDEVVSFQFGSMDPVKTSTKTSQQSRRIVSQSH